MKPEDKVVNAYYISRKNSLYYNQIKELSGLSDSSLSNTLKKMVNFQVLNLNKQKSNTYYEMLDKKYFSLLFSQIALKKFKELSLGVKKPIERLLGIIGDDIFAGILFGSASRKEETSESDIDLVIITDSDLNLDSIKRKIESTSKYPLNIFQFSSKEFRENKDWVLKQAKETGFPVKGEQYFFERVINEI